jgi:hypothetical protein
VLLPYTDKAGRGVTVESPNELCCLQPPETGLCLSLTIGLASCKVNPPEASMSAASCLLATLEIASVARVRMHVTEPLTAEFPQKEG